MKKALLTTCVVALTASSTTFAANKILPLADTIKTLDSKEYAFTYKSYTPSRQSPLITAMLQAQTKAGSELVKKLSDRTTGG
ncbi:MAG: Unknown protein [uncultured Thiotrichaceae bacterium]|uniref:Uncharacterized protein n=1 Tax=uncultured Thiotrichaceae bacterium TaxID=298394 RepID=A0A6S6SWS3_9GAMM|nr:MAG: Unknown protein [uncultured Thiotrichaceae bacterium]